MNVEKIIKEYEETIFCRSNRKPFDISTKWAKHITEKASIYAFFEKGKIVYVGESRSLKARMRDVRRTVNHTLRRNIGVKLFSHIKGYEKATSKQKFPEHIEQKVNEYMETLHVVVVPILFGRTEIEEYLVYKHKPKFNTKTKRAGA